MPTPLRRISYWDAMDTYGSDKPDTRYGMELVDLTDVFVSSAFKVFASAANTQVMWSRPSTPRRRRLARAQIDKLAKSPRRSAPRAWLGSPSARTAP